MKKPPAALSPVFLLFFFFMLYLNGWQHSLGGGNIPPGKPPFCLQIIPLAEDSAVSCRGVVSLSYLLGRITGRALEDRGPDWKQKSPEARSRVLIFLSSVRRVAKG